MCVVLEPLIDIKVGTTFLSTDQAELITMRDIFGSGRFTENCNKVLCLLAKSGRSTLKYSDGNKFVQAPVVTKSEVKEIVKALLTPLRMQRRKERVVVQAAQKLTAEPVKKPRVLFVTPDTHSADLSQPSTMRQTPTLPYQPDDRGVPVSPTAEVPLPDSPDVVLSIGFCREKLKKKIELWGNDHKRLRGDHNFAMCMHALATFHRSFDPIKLVDGKGYFHLHAMDSIQRMQTVGRPRNA